MKLRHSVNQQRGFTLIELLVVVAVIALLIGILLPALGAARSSAYTASAASLQRNLVVGMVTFTNSSNDFLPGVNTSGYKLFDPSQHAEQYQIISQDGSQPVQAWDWMSPSLDGDTLALNREARFAYLYNELADPAQEEFGSSWGDASGVGVSEMEQYILNELGGTVTAMSYAMPTVFGQYGLRRIGPGLSPPPPGYIRLTNGVGWGDDRNIALPPTSYVPKLSSIQGGSRKVAITSATRYIEQNGLITTDFSLRGGYYQGSAFQDHGPIHSESPAFGMERSNGLAGRITYRHQGRLVCAFFDGSTRTVTRAESYDPALWFPRGTVLGTGEVVPEALDFVEADRVID